VAGGPPAHAALPDRADPRTASWGFGRPRLPGRAVAGAADDGTGLGRFGAPRRLVDLLPHPVPKLAGSSGTGGWPRVGVVFRPRWRNVGFGARVRGHPRAVGGDARSRSQENDGQACATGSGGRGGPTGGAAGGRPGGGGSGPGGAVVRWWRLFLP